MEYRYFISYSYNGGFGSSEFIRNRPISSYKDDIKGLMGDIEKEWGITGVIILNWILL